MISQTSNKSVFNLIHREYQHLTSINAQHTCGFSILSCCTPKSLSFSDCCLAGTFPRSSLLKSQRTSNLIWAFYFPKSVMVVAWVAGFPGTECWGAHHPPEDQAIRLLPSLLGVQTPFLSCAWKYRRPSNSRSKVKREKGETFKFPWRTLRNDDFELESKTFSQLQAL